MNKLTIIKGRFQLILFKKGGEQVKMNMEGLTDEGIKIIWDSVAIPSNCESAMLYGFHELDFPVFEKKSFQSATNTFVIMHVCYDV